MKYSKDPVQRCYSHEQWLQKCLSQPSPLHDAPLIPDFFANREIFITGGTGFIGKALIEKLLRSCPDIKAIYMLMRPKKGQQIGDRLKSICDLVLFDLLRQKNPKFMDKLIPIAGDVAERGLGISDEDRARLRNVSVVFHSAASIRFNDPLRHAILMNTRGTHELIKLAESFMDVKVILHVSTAYCNCNHLVVEEKVYPPLTDWRKAIEICEKIDNQDELDILTRHFMSFMPNTYTFSKHLAEQVLDDYKEKFPICILRPSVVISSIMDPFGGWVDNLNGPIGLWLGIATGMLKTIHGDGNNVMDMISVDILVRSMIIAAWKRANEDFRTLPVINAVFGHRIKFELAEVCDVLFNGPFDEFPLGRKMLMMPGCMYSMCKYKVRFLFFFYQFLPALFVDFFMKIRGKKFRVMKLQRKIHEAGSAIGYFISRDWIFKSDNFDELTMRLRGDDLRAFDIGVFETFSPGLIVRYVLYGMRRYLMNLKDENLERDRKFYRRAKLIGRVVRAAIFVGLLCFFVVKFRGLF